MTLRKDYAYEALAASTGTDMQQGRGELNAALHSIRKQTTLTGQLLAGEIQVRARQYRRLMPDVVLTPNALAKHWVRVAEAAARPTGTNLHAADSRCPTCTGDRFVPIGDEQWSPCPDCGVEVSWWRYDGTRAVTLDPARTREMMHR